MLSPKGRKCVAGEGVGKRLCEVSVLTGRTAALS